MAGTGGKGKPGEAPDRWRAAGAVTLRGLLSSGAEDAVVIGQIDDLEHERYEWRRVIEDGTARLEIGVTRMDWS